MCDVRAHWSREAASIAVQRNLWSRARNGRACGRAARRGRRAGPRRHPGRGGRHWSPHWHAAVRHRRGASPRRPYRADALCGQQLHDQAARPVGRGADAGVLRAVQRVRRLRCRPPWTGPHHGRGGEVARLRAVLLCSAQLPLRGLQEYRRPSECRELWEGPAPCDADGDVDGAPGVLLREAGHLLLCLLLGVRRRLRAARRRARERRDSRHRAAGWQPEPGHGLRRGALALWRLVHPHAQHHGPRAGQGVPPDRQGGGAVLLRRLLRGICYLGDPNPGRCVAAPLLKTTRVGATWGPGLPKHGSSAARPSFRCRR